ncbi:anhydro-N-acetylmuramic acid kinase [Hugenholtzia roseola]|uniref:anhydro-N-acetylmuramic acid kinase n=1 Tax=Hugenholtzia roseola TaxID=1002 RepID=UPI00041C02C8|nr:anhydro-N-acetylmuramic acid kinase [Hugenholtzia roseola]
MVYLVIGLMSGTSLDGLDVAAVRFEEVKGTKNSLAWRYELVKTQTFPYSEVQKGHLAALKAASALDFFMYENEWTQWVAEKVNHFLAEISSEIPLLVAFHGHTVFHQPAKGLTLQMGNGSLLAAQTGLSVVYDFRRQDVALGGQGAPLVPMGDKLLFSDIDFCLNLGGIANISFEIAGKRLAFDVCPANMVLNFLAQKLDKPYDAEGKMAASGNFLPALFEELSKLPFYAAPYPKSLGAEWVESQIFPILENYLAQNETFKSKENLISDLLHTFCEHIAYQISEIIEKIDKNHKTTLLITGGGAWNRFLIQRLALRLPEVQIEIATQELTDFKEALIFAFLGLLRYLERPNALASVTGAKTDHSCGVIAKPF